VDHKGRDGRWFGLDDMWAFWDYMYHYHRGPTIAVFGEMLHDHEWQEHAERKVEELFGTKKTSWWKRERRYEARTQRGR
jgi:hypothetical protein